MTLSYTQKLRESHTLLSLFCLDKWLIPDFASFVCYQTEAWAEFWQQEINEGKTNIQSKVWLRWIKVCQLFLSFGFFHINKNDKTRVVRFSANSGISGMEAETRGTASAFFITGLYTAVQLFCVWLLGVWILTQYGKCKLKRGLCFFQVSIDLKKILIVWRWAVWVYTWFEWTCAIRTVEAQKRRVSELECVSKESGRRGTIEGWNHSSFVLHLLIPLWCTRGIKRKLHSRQNVVPNGQGSHLQTQNGNKLWESQRQR